MTKRFFITLLLTLIVSISSSYAMEPKVGVPEKIPEKQNTLVKKGKNIAEKFEEIKNKITEKVNGVIGDAKAAMEKAKEDFANSEFGQSVQSGLDKAKDLKEKVEEGKEELEKKKAELEAEFGDEKEIAMLSAKKAKISSEFSAKIKDKESSFEDYKAREIAPEMLKINENITKLSSSDTALLEDLTKAKEDLSKKEKDALARKEQEISAIKREKEDVMKPIDKMIVDLGEKIAKKRAEKQINDIKGKVEDDLEAIKKTKDGIALGKGEPVNSVTIERIKTATQKEYVKAEMILMQSVLVELNNIKARENQVDSLREGIAGSEIVASITLSTLIDIESNKSNLGMARLNAAKLNEKIRKELSTRKVSATENDSNEIKDFDFDIYSFKKKCVKKKSFLDKAKGLVGKVKDNPDIMKKVGDVAGGKGLPNIKEGLPI